MPKISVLMPVYNGQTYMREAVESILNQTFTDFEFIIVDDGSTDETPAILDEYRDPRIKRIRNENNIQLVKSLNKGLSEARGEYIARQDADDRSAPERLAKQVAFLDSHPKTGVIGTWFKIIDTKGYEVRVVKLPTENNIIQDELLLRNCFCHGSVMFRRNCLDEPLSYREDLLLIEDWELWLRIGERNHLKNLAEPLYSWRLLPTSLSQANKIAERKVIRRFLEEIMRRRTDEMSWLAPTDRAKARYHLFLACDDLAKGEDHSAEGHLQKAFAIDTELARNTDFIQDYIVDSAFELCVASRQSVSEAIAEKGIAFIRKLFKLLPLIDGENYPVGKAVSKFYIKLAFANYQMSCLYQVRRYCLAGLIWDPRWLKDKGVSSIFLESLIGGRIMEKIRTITRRLPVLHNKIDRCPM